MLLDGVDVGRSNELVDLVPAAAHKSTHTTHALVIASRGIVLSNQCPGIHWRFRHCQGGAPALQQPASHHWVLDAVGAVQIPAVAGTARAATRLVVGHVPAGARVVGLLGFPGDDAAFDIDLPGTGAGAVHAVCAAHDLVMRPAGAVGIFPGTVFARGTAVAASKALLGQAKVGEAVEEMTHGSSRFLVECQQGIVAWRRA